MAVKDGFWKGSGDGLGDGGQCIVVIVWADDVAILALFDRNDNMLDPSGKTNELVFVIFDLIGAIVKNMRISVQKIASPCLRRHTAPSVRTGHCLRSSQGSKLDDVYRYYDGLFITAGT